MLAAALLLAFLIVRIATVQAFIAKDPSRAAAFWPGHPTAFLESGLSEVGKLAAAGRPIERPLIEPLLATSTKAPLAPEPFLVRGVEAQLAGNEHLALQAFLAARQRDPRATAARYFLADHYLKAGENAAGLAEVSALARLVPQSLPSVAPFLASYARSPGAAPHVKAMLQGEPQLERVLLDQLAADPGNLNLMLHLWNGRGGDDAKLWQSRLLNGLIDSGRVDEARNAWMRFAGIKTEKDRLVDAEFTAHPPPPFGWTLASGPAGAAEPLSGGRLHLLFYGRDDAVLASQLLTLPPGRYRLSMQVGGVSATPKSLSWTLKCLAGAATIVSIPLDRAGAIAASITVPGGCPAQRLELVGNALEIPEQSEATISHLELHHEGGS